MNTEAEPILVKTTGGLTKRERFALAAMQGLLANPAAVHQEYLGRLVTGAIQGRAMARAALACTDTLLAELEKKGP